MHYDIQHKQENEPNKFHVNFIDSSRHCVPDGWPEHCGVSRWTGPVFSESVDAGVALRGEGECRCSWCGSTIYSTSCNTIHCPAWRAVCFTTRAQPQQHQPQQQHQQQQQPQPQPQFWRPVCRTFQRFLISHCNISSIMIVNFKKIHNNLCISNLKLNVMINADKMAFIKKEYVFFKHLFLSMHSFFTQENQPRGTAGDTSASYTDLLPAAHRGRMQYPCGNGKATGADGQWRDHHNLRLEGDRDNGKCGNHR